MSDELSLPLDIRLMNLMAWVMLLAFAALLLGAAALWVARQPVFFLHGIGVTGELTHNNAVTLRANVTPALEWHFLQHRSGAHPTRLRVLALGAQGGGAA